MKLSDIQQKLKAPKNQRNNFGNYNYRNCEDILEALKPLLGDSVLTISDEIVQFPSSYAPFYSEKTGQLIGGERFYVKATATFKDGINVSSVTAFARESFDKKGMDAAQITGAASSYARKYALNGLFLIDDTKDADTQDNTQPKEPMKSYKVERKVPAADDEAGGAVIQDEEAVLNREEIELTQKEQIKDLMKALKLPTTKLSVINATGLSMKPEHYEQIIAKLKAKHESTDPLAEAIKE